MDPTITTVRTQRVLDACVALLEQRLRVIHDLAAGTGGSCSQFVGTGQDLAAWTMAQSHQWSHLLSTRPITRTSDLRRSMPNNRRLRRGGLQMVSVYDERGTEAGARRILELEPDNAYFFAESPIQMRIIDQTVVLLPGQEDPESILHTSSPLIVAAAMHYWHAVMSTARPCRAPAGDEVHLSVRQRGIVELLREGMTDQQIAHVLDLSVRTIRSEISTVMQRYGVHSRFALGYAHGRSSGPAAE